MISIFTLISARVVLGQVDLRIPLDVDHRTGRLYANVTTLPSGSGPMPMPISLREYSLAVFEGPFVYGETRMRIDGNTSFEFTDRRLYFASLQDDPNVGISSYPNERSHLAISSLSPLVQAAGAVAIIRRNNPPSAELVIGSSSLAFNQTCLSAAVRITQQTTAHNAEHFPRYLNAVSGRMGVAGTGANSTLGGRSGDIRFSDLTYLSVDRLVYNYVVDSIVESGMVLTGNSNFGATFVNCTAENMRYLPSIQVVFDNSEGTLELFPEDYLDVTTNPGSCRLKMRRRFPRALVHGGPISSIDLLNLSNYNVRISSDQQIEICKAM